MKQRVFNGKYPRFLFMVPCEVKQLFQKQYKVDPKTSYNWGKKELLEVG